MILKEFFGRPLNLKTKTKSSEYDEDSKDSVFEFILNHDRLYKEYFIPVARKIKEDAKTNKTDKEECVKKFMPMVEKGCLEYYHHKKMTGKPSTIFPKELREELCERLYDHYYEGIIKDCYSIGI